MAMVSAMTMFDFEKVKVNGIITPKDGTVRSNLDVDVSLGNDILETTTTDSNGKYNFEFFIPSGSYMHVPMICCGNNKKTVFDIIQDSPNQTVLQVIETDLTITSTKDILSFEDNEVATINATLTYGTIPQPIEGEEISFVIKDSQNNIIDTQVSTTDSNGIASIVYESQGIGDVTISASIGGFVSKTYSIEDCEYYDPSSSSGVSNYYSNNSVSMTYDSSNSAYLLQKGGSGMGTMVRNTLRFSNSCILKADVKLLSSTDNIQTALGLLNGTTGLDGKVCRATAVNAYAISLIEGSKTGYGSNEVSISLTSSDVQLDVWYTLEISIDGSNQSFTVYNGSTVVGTVTKTSSVLSADSNELAIWHGFGGAKALIKNIKVKPL